MNIEIICPLYNAENYLENLNERLKMQKNVEIKKIQYIFTKGKDRTEQLLKKISAEYLTIEPKEFSHSLTREKAALKSTADILVFITQDIEIKNDNWLENLVKPIINNEAEAAFSRQLTKYNNLEKYTRERNYPSESYINTKADIETKGLRTFFFSDASSAIKTNIFKALNGYDNKDLPTNEDMYIAYKIIMNNYRIKYCADSVVYHSHKFTLKQLYKRYYDTGRFFKQESYLDKYGTTDSGANLAKYILKRIFQEKRFLLLFRYPFDMAARLIGMKVGKS